MTRYPPVLKFSHSPPGNLAAGLSTILNFSREAGPTRSPPARDGAAQ